MAQEWNIRCRSNTCAVCGKAFQDKEICMSALKAVTEGYERVDTCLACWKTTQRDWEPFSAWETEYIAPVSSVRVEHVKKENAEALLRRLIALEDPEMQNVVYVLAVMLERGKQLVERDARPHENGILRVYEHKNSGDTFVVLDPRLRLDQIGGVQQQVVSLLSGTHHLSEQPAAAPAVSPETPADESSE